MNHTNLNFPSLTFRLTVRAALSAAIAVTLVLSGPLAQARDHDHDRDDDNDRRRYEEKRDKDHREREKKLEREVDQVRAQMALGRIGQAIKDRKDAKKRDKELQEQRDRDRERDYELFRAREQARDNYELYPRSVDTDRREVLYGRVDGVFTGSSFSLYSSGRSYRVTLRGLPRPRTLSPDDEVRVEGYSDGLDFYAYDLSTTRDR